jgi:hypothetical protein
LLFQCKVSLCGRNDRSMDTLRHVILNDQLRTGIGRRIATLQAEIIGNGVIVVIQLEAQAELGQSAGQVGAVPFTGKGGPVYNPLHDL